MCVFVLKYGKLSLLALLIYTTAFPFQHNPKHELCGRWCLAFQASVTKHSSTRKLDKSSIPQWKSCIYVPHSASHIHYKILDLFCRILCENHDRFSTVPELMFKTFVLKFSSTNLEL